jgi:type II secretory pathway pseudopilin PulG
MSALSTRTDISGTPSKATAQAAFTALYDFVASRFQSGTTGVTAATSAELLAARTSLGVSALGYFYKADTGTVAFTKTGPSTLAVKAATVVEVAGVIVTFAIATTVVMPSLTAGTDYAIYACQDGTIRADSSFSAPSGYSTANSRQIGGFHYGLVAPATTLAGGSFNTAGSPVGGGMVWVQGDVDNIAGINLFSLWDLKWRPRATSPKGMVLVSNQTWVDIYLCNTDTTANGTSRYNTNIASGTVLPKVPAAFGGNGTLTYSTLTWWEANELARANTKRLMFASEFYDAAFGVTENQSIDATTVTYPTTLRNAGYTSKYGIEQASGHHWIWGMDASGTTPTAYAANGGRGQSYNNLTTRVILGGSRTGGAVSGSRYANFYGATSNSGWNIGLRAACDHLQLV